eukprot:6187099-Pleurochrysis_carterae.AAC.1
MRAQVPCMRHRRAGTDRPGRERTGGEGGHGHAARGRRRVAVSETDINSSKKRFHQTKVIRKVDFQFGSPIGTDGDGAEA